MLKYEGKFRASKTRAPETVFILDEFLETADNPTVLRAARAGFGDFFAGISAAIDYSFQRGNFTRSEIEELAAFYFNAVDWVLNRFNGFNRMAMRRLARYSHASSLMVIKRGNTELSAGGEHKLYYAIMESHLYNGALKPFHGELVAAGSLMNVWAFARQTGSYDLLKKFRTMCAHLGLPVDLAGLEQIGLSCADMLQAWCISRVRAAFWRSPPAKFRLSLLSERFLMNSQSEVILVSFPLSWDTRAMVDLKPPVNLIYLASWLNSKEIGTRILDASQRQLDLPQTLAEIKTAAPKWVGIPFYQGTEGTAAKLCRALKAEMPEIRAIGGGPLLTAMPDR